MDMQTCRFVKLVSENIELSGAEGRIILRLLTGDTLTKSMLVKALGLSEKHVSRSVKALVNADILQVDRIEGRNIFYKINLKPDIQDKRQIKITDLVG